MSRRRRTHQLPRELRHQVRRMWQLVIDELSQSALRIKDALIREID